MAYFVYSPKTQVLMLSLEPKTAIVLGEERDADKLTNSLTKVLEKEGQTAEKIDLNRAIFMVMQFGFAKLIVKQAAASAEPAEAATAA